VANGGRVGSSGINKTRPTLLGPVGFVGFGPWGTLGMAPPRVVLEVRGARCDGGNLRIYGWGHV
jgi:hypothetical protein